MKNIVTRLRTRIAASPFGDTILHSLNYFAKSVATQGISFISIPVFTYFLTTADYGILNIFTSYVAIGSVLLTLNAQVGINRYYHEKQTDFGSLIFMSVVLSVSLLFVFFILSVFLDDKLGEWLDLPADTIPFMVPSILVIVFSHIILSVFKTMKNSRVVRNYSIHKTYFSFILAVVIMLFMKEKMYLGRLWADVGVLLVFGVYTYILLKPYIQYELKKVHVSYLLRYSVPLIPAYLSSYLLSYFDRIMINSYIGAESAGLYSFAYNISSLQVMIFTALSYAWEPDFYKLMNDGKFTKIDQDLTRINRLVAIGSCGLVLFADQLGILLGTKEYHAGLTMIPVIVLGQYFMTLTFYYKNQVNYFKKTWISAVVISLGAVVNIVLNVIYIPKYGMYAAPYTTLVAYIFQTVLMAVWVKFWVKGSHFTNPLKLADGILVMVLAVIMYYVFENRDWGNAVNIASKFGILLLIGCLMYGKYFAKRFGLLPVK